jgi:hypothetical protein
MVRLQSMPAPAAVTPIFAEPCTPFEVAVIEVLPTPRPVTRPLLVNALLTWAIPLLPEVQLTRLVRPSVVPSLNVPVAVRRSVVPLAIAGSRTTVRELSVGAVKATVVAPWTPPRVAVIGALPTARPVTSPIVGEALLTCAIEFGTHRDESGLRQSRPQARPPHAGESRAQGVRAAQKRWAANAPRIGARSVFQTC